MQLVLVLALLVACDGAQPQPRGGPGSAQPGTAPGAAPTADDCQRFLVKSRPTLTSMSKAAGMTYSASIEARALTDCRADVAAGKRSPLIGCVLDAVDEAAVRACFPRYDELVPVPGGLAGSAAGGTSATAGTAATAGTSAPGVDAAP